MRGCPADNITDAKKKLRQFHSALFSFLICTNWSWQLVEKKIKKKKQQEDLWLQPEEKWERSQENLWHHIQAHVNAAVSMWMTWLLQKSTRLRGGRGWGYMHLCYRYKSGYKITIRACTLILSWEVGTYQKWRSYLLVAWHQQHACVSH